MTSKQLCILVIDEDDPSLLVAPLEQAGYTVAYETADTAAAMGGRFAMPKWDFVLCANNTPALGTLAALEESEARFITIASNIPGMAYQMIPDASGRFVFPYVSEGAYALLGVQPHTYSA